ncbi:Os01g0772000, partial [Oryza sativa Japonica Group]
EERHRTQTPSNQKFVRESSRFDRRDREDVQVAAAGAVPAAAVGAAGVHPPVRGPRPRPALRRHRLRQRRGVPHAGRRRAVGQGGAQHRRQGRLRPPLLPPAAAASPSLRKPIFLQKSVANLCSEEGQTVAFVPNNSGRSRSCISVQVSSDCRWQSI